MRLTVSVTRQDRAAGGLAPKAPRTGVDITVDAADGELGVGQELTEAATRAGRELLAGLGVEASDAITVDVEPLEPLVGRVDLTITLEPALKALEELERFIGDARTALESDPPGLPESPADRAADLNEITRLAGRVRRELVEAGAGGAPDGHNKGAGDDYPAGGEEADR